MTYRRLIAQPSNNRAKFPALVLGAAICLLAGLALLVNGDTVFGLVGIAVGLAAGLGAAAVRRGRNPWWVRAPADYRSRSRKAP